METMADDRLRMLARLHKGSVRGSIGETMHRLAAEILAAREALRAADALAEAAESEADEDSHATILALEAYRAARGAR